jgi:hypothetical protein
VTMMIIRSRLLRLCSFVRSVCCAEAIIIYRYESRSTIRAKGIDLSDVFLVQGAMTFSLARFPETLVNKVDRIPVRFEIPQGNEEKDIV